MAGIESVKEFVFWNGFLLNLRQMIPCFPPRRADARNYTFSKKKCFSNALRHTLVVLGMH